MAKNKVKIGGVDFEHIFVRNGNLHYLMPVIKDNKEQVEKVVDILTEKCCGSYDHMEMENAIVFTDDSYTHLIPYYFD